MNKYVSYYRVSTKKQGQSGLGLAAQRECIAGYLQSVGGKLCSEYIEVESGKLTARPELGKALATCRIHSATLIVAKLDRLARDAHFITGLQREQGVEFCAVDFPAANRLVLTIIAAVAEYEAKLISDRTMAALVQAAKRGVQIGGYADNCAEIARKGSKASARVRTKAAAQRARDLQPVIQELRSSGATTLVAIAAGLNERGITTTRGNQWSPTAVMRVLEGLKGQRIEFVGHQ